MKRYLSILLVALLSLSVFAGCSNSEEKDANNEASQQTAVDTSVQTTVTTKADSTKTTAAPTTEQLVEGYFDVISHYEKGSAGSSLKLCKTATEVFQFAQDYNIDSCDIDTLRANMMDAWENVLTEEDRGNFDENFMDVVTFMDTAQKNPEENAGLLEDAGVAEEFNAIADKDGAWDNWNTLMAHTLTMGNSEE